MGHPPPRRTVTGVIDQVGILLDAVSDVRSTLGVLRDQTSELRGENAAAHRGIDNTLQLLRREVDGVIVTQQEHGRAIAEQQVRCAHRHAHDTDETRKVQGIDQRLSAIEQGSVHRAASRRDLWLALGGLTAIIGAAVGAARLFIGG